jgi:hypothetical protein
MLFMRHRVGGGEGDWRPAHQLGLAAVSFGQQDGKP